jgi:hypothetical protein
MTSYLWGLQKVKPAYDVCEAIIDVMYTRGKISSSERSVPFIRSSRELALFEMNMFGLINEVSQKVESLKTYPAPILFPRHGAFCGLFGCEYEHICRQALSPKNIPPGFVRDSWYEEDIEVIHRQSSDYLKAWEGFKQI